MLAAQLVEDPLLGPLQHRPEGLHALGVDFIPDRFPGSVVDCLVGASDAHAGRCLGGVDLRLGSRVFLHETLQRPHVGGIHDLHPDLLRGPDPDAGDDRLSDGFPTGVKPLPRMPVALPAVHVCLVRLDGARERFAPVVPGLPDAVGRMPRGLLRRPRIPVPLHRRHSLQSGRVQEEREGPCAEARMRSLHQGSRLRREVPAAIPATPGPGPAGRVRLGVERTAGRAVHAVGPADRDEPFLGRRVVGEHVHDLHPRDALAPVPSGRVVRHDPVPRRIAEADYPARSGGVR